MVTRAEIVTEARSWLATPFHHQAELKGVGVDCAGLLRGVCIALGLLPAEYRLLPIAAPYVGYGTTPDGVRMQKACETFMTPIAIDEMQPGDAILIRWGRHPQHVALLADYRHGGLSIIHSYTDASGRGEVIEQRLDEPMRRRIVAAYRLPGVVA
jgi:NlpC/P60 family putative phage cell wall peptidase